MNIQINETNAKKVFAFLKKEVKSLSYTQKTDKLFDRKILAAERRYRRDNTFTKENLDAEKQKINDWYAKSKEYIDEKSGYKLYDNSIFHNQTVLTIIYNRLRRGDRRPHTGSVESDSLWLATNQYDVKQIENYISKRFPMEIISEEVKENV